MIAPTVTCYPSPNKPKAYMLCKAFAQGAKGAVMDNRHGLKPGPAFFYGVVQETLPLWQRAVADGRDWYYCDNAYFDRGREAQFRITKNAFQISDIRFPNYKKMDTLGVKIKPWREVSADAPILVCEQSSSFMHLCGYGAGWTDRVVETLRAHTARPIKVRRWSRNKAAMSASLKDDLENAWALVTHMSASANEALISGVPVFVTGTCAASPLASNDLSLVESPFYPENRKEWAGSLVANQWSIAEISEGQAWRDLQL